MPRRSKVPCQYPGCPALIEPGTGGYCEQHKRPAKDERKSAAARGYGSNWRKTRAMYLRRHPLCADPFGEHERDGVVVPATDVHHIVAKRDGGRDNYDNLQALCHSCHSRLTAQGE